VVLYQIPSTNPQIYAIRSILFFDKNFSCICRTTKIASVVPFPGLNPICIPYNVTLFLTPAFITLSKSSTLDQAALFPYMSHIQEHKPFPFIHIQQSTFSPIHWNVPFHHNLITNISRPQLACITCRFEHQTGCVCKDATGKTQKAHNSAVDLVLLGPYTALTFLKSFLYQSNSSYSI
jgi:hypothetical protein